MRVPADADVRVEMSHSRGPFRTIKAKPVTSKAPEAPKAAPGIDSPFGN